MYKKTYPTSIIIKSLNLYDKIKSFRKVSTIVKVSKSTIHRWWVSLHALRKKNKLQKRKVHRKPKYEDLSDKISLLFQSDTLSYFTLGQIRDNLQGSKPSFSTIHRALKKAKITRRRFETTKVCPRSQLDMDGHYKRFKEHLEKYQDDQVVCIDETYLCNIGNQSYGYFNRGKIPIVKNVSKRQKFSMAVAITPNKVLAIDKQRNAFTKESFNRFIMHSVVPAMDSNMKALLMDNVAFHKNKELLSFLQNKGIDCIFIPPYSPRCNPIEEVFSVIKRKFRADFGQKVDTIIDYTKMFSDMKCFYNHTRNHII